MSLKRAHDGEGEVSAKHTKTDPIEDLSSTNSTNNQQTEDELTNSAMPAGLVAVAKMNSKRHFFLASKENYFAGHRVENVMVDSGCNTLLLPIGDGELISFVTKFPKKTYKWEISNSNRVSHYSLVLNISLNTAGPMSIDLCKDLLSDATPASSDFFRFHLCTADMKTILKYKELSAMLSSDGLKRIREYTQKHSTPIKRKAHGLLGQALLRDSACIQLRGVMAIFQPEKYSAGSPKQVWEDIADLRGFLNANGDLLPDGFDDLEDEDHVLEAVDTDHEDYHPFVKLDFIDECE